MNGIAGAKGMCVGKSTRLAYDVLAHLHTVDVTPQPLDERPRPSRLGASQPLRPSRAPERGASLWIEERRRDDTFGGLPERDCLARAALWHKELYEPGRVEVGDQLRP